jgi:16S rRNA (uracil1498-N3)-methyltransferase
MPARLYLPLPLLEGAALTLPADAARHVQVLRLQPGHALTLFNGDGAEWSAEVTRMGKHEVDVQVGGRLPVRDAELPQAVTLALGMPANERMDALVEKATELGVATVQPLQCARSVLKLQGERAERRQAHWQSVAQSAAEQSGRTRVPVVAPIATLDAWLGAMDAEAGAGRHVLSFAPDAQGAAALPGVPAAITLLSGPEGGLDPREEALARRCGFAPLSLGPRVLRADTAPLAALAYLGLR